MYLPLSKVAISSELRVNHRASYWRMRVDEFNHQTSVKKAELRQEIESLKKKISSLDLDNAEMSETLESILFSFALNFDNCDSAPLSFLSVLMASFVYEFVFLLINNLRTFESFVGISHYCVHFLLKFLNLSF